MTERSTTFSYQRRGNLARVTLKNQTNHELREILIGFWSRLDDADRRDHINELLHYVDALATPDAYPERYLSPVAEAIRAGVDGKTVVADLLQIERRRKAR
jgi:hypothetical protein